METWTDVIAPGDVWVTDNNTIYVVEQGGSGRVSVWSSQGELLSRFTESEGGVLEVPHVICVDDEGVSTWRKLVGRVGGSASKSLLASESCK